METSANIRVLIIGCGHMGASHARAYAGMPHVQIVGLVARGHSKQKLAAALGADLPLFDDLRAALEATTPDAVCISTYPDTHEAMALQALRSGCHVFVEKPLATTVAGAQRVVAAARQADKQLVVGYILRHHPTWQRFIHASQGLGSPLVMRMNLNQQSAGHEWEVHRSLLASVSPIVDCGVHYVDVMCQMTRSRPVRVSAIYARLDDTLPSGSVNYGQLQVIFDDGSVGWYEAGWGPMMSETAYFVKDVIGPLGSASLVNGIAGGDGNSADVEGHTQASAIRIHHAALDANGGFARPDDWIREENAPDHDTLCRHEQQFFIESIAQQRDLSRHHADCVISLAIVLAADESARTGAVVTLPAL